MFLSFLHIYLLLLNQSQNLLRRFLVKLLPLILLIFPNMLNFLVTFLREALVYTARFFSLCKKSIVNVNFKFFQHILYSTPPHPHTSSTIPAEVIFFPYLLITGVFMSVTSSSESLRYFYLLSQSHRFLKPDLPLMPSQISQNIYFFFARGAPYLDIL